jgi:hypothetical protein
VTGGRRPAGLAAVLAVGIAFGGCDAAGIGLAETFPGELSCEAPVVLARLPSILYEASGITRDPRRDDLFWTHNDSGNAAEIFALDATGRVLAVVPITRATERDIEDIATGPCPGGDCLYLADIGDNFAVRGFVTIHRLPLPPLPAGLDRGSADSGKSAPMPGPSAPISPSASWKLVYPNGARDAESVAIDGKRNEILIVTKGREGTVELHVAAIDRLDDGSGQPDTLRRVGRLAIPVGNNTAQYVTAGDLSPDGGRLALRSYATLYEFAWPGSGAFDTLAAPTHAPLIGALEAQGEGLGWTTSGESLMLISEGRGDRPPTLSRIRCAPGESAGPEAARAEPRADRSPPGNPPS